MNRYIEVPFNDDKNGVYLDYRKVPAKWTVCEECSGEGQHAHHIDGNGLTGEDLMEWDDEMLNDYCTGRYNQSCGNCKGRGLVLTIDDNAASKEDIALYYKWQKEEHMNRQYERMEQRYCGDYY